MLIEDPVLLHSPDGKEQKRIPAVDAAGWMALGWTREKVPVSKLAAVQTPVAELPSSSSKVTSDDTFTPDSSTHPKAKK